ncbi:MAG: DivIVA domain-containing protein [Oscillospiraceae bacterium]
MLSSREIAEKRFEKDKFGYKAEDVETFLRAVAHDYAAALNTAQENEAKIIKLVEKINEYREDEEAIKLALIGAQKESAKVVGAAKAEAQRMLSEAKEQQEMLAEQSAAECERLIMENKERCAALILENNEKTERKINETKRLLKAEQERFNSLRVEISRFKTGLAEILHRQLSVVSELPELNDDEIEALISAKAAPVYTAPEPIEEEPIAEVPVITEAATPEKEEPDPFAFAKDPYASSDAVSKFGDLRFGKNN